ncbi:MAG TPA: lasso peptide biosynthesis B2 protein [Gemmatimonadales bacterium]|jgi:hypothetical protein
MVEPAQRPPTPRDLLDAAEAACWLVVASALLRVLPFGRLFRELPPSAPSPALDPGNETLVPRVRRAVGAVAERLPWAIRCLPRALAGVLMCRVRGARVPIALSVTNGGRPFGAHARLDAGSEAELAEGAPDGRTHLGRIILTV